MMNNSEIETKICGKTATCAWQAEGMPFLHVPLTVIFEKTLCAYFQIIICMNPKSKKTQ